jgi:hypothetical protein
MSVCINHTNKHHFDSAVSKKDSTAAAPCPYDHHSSADDTSSNGSSSSRRGSIGPESCVHASSSSSTQQQHQPCFVPVLPDMGHLYPRRNTSSQGNVPWRCYSCSSRAFGHRCATCHAQRDMYALRVFVGQLSREGAGAIVPAMVHALCGEELSSPSAVLHVEPHTKAATGAGTGSAWIYVDSVEDMLLIVRRLHKRTYVTIDYDTGAVGFLCHPHSFSDALIHKRCMEELESLTHEARELLHFTSPVTAEVPNVLAKAFARAAPLSSVAAAAAPSRGGHHHHQYYHGYSSNTHKQSGGKFSPFVAALNPSATIAMPPSLAMHFGVCPPPPPPSYTTPVKNAALTASPSSSSVASPANKDANATRGARYMWNPYSAVNAKDFISSSSNKQHQQQ